MDIKVEQGSIEASAADTLIVNLFEGVTTPGGATGALDRALGGAISDLIAGGDLKGKAGEVAVLYPRGAVGARRVLVVGLGKAEAFDVEGVRRASAAAIKRARDLNAQHVATIVHGAGIGGLDPATAAQATVEGALLATYRFAAQKQREAANEIASLTIVERDAGRLDAIRQGATLGEAVAGGVALARDLVNMPPNVATPTRLAEQAREIAAARGLAVTVVAVIHRHLPHPRH